MNGDKMTDQDQTSFPQSESGFNGQVGQVTNGREVHYIHPGDPEREVYRLSTYLKFPAIAPVDVIELARHGYYYTGYKDRVKCFSCGAFVQDWCPQDDPRLARWHLQGCKFVLGTDTSNKPIGTNIPEFVGTFTSSLSNEDNSYFFSTTFSLNGRSASSENLGQTHSTRSSFPSMLPVVEEQSMDNNEESYSSILSPSPGMSSLTTGVDDVETRHNPSLSKNDSVSNSSESSIEEGRRSNANRVTVRGLDLASTSTCSHRQLLVQQLDLHKEKDRKKSFAKWKCLNAKPEDLAKSGFFYLGNLDRCQCFSCSGVLRNWRFGDCVEDEHRRHYPNCKMILGQEHTNIPLDTVALMLTEPTDPSPEEELRLEREFPCLHPINPHMRDYEARLKTFDQRWPSFKVLATKEHIAKAGFFFLGEKDRAKCWYCNGGIQNWDPNDEPFTEHAKWFPGCEYILRCKGVDFVRTLVEQFPGLPRPALRCTRFDHETLQVIDSSDAPPTQNPICDQREKHVTEKIPKIKRLNLFPSFTSEMQISARKKGFTKEQIRSAIEISKETGRTFSNPQDFIQFLHELNQVDLQLEDFLSTENPTEQHNQVLNRNTLKRRNTAGIDEQKFADQEAPSFPKVLKTGSSEDFARELSALENERKCQSCRQRLADIVLVPCGHLSLCGKCSPSTERCPVCQAKISKKIKVFLQ